MAADTDGEERVVTGPTDPSPGAKRDAAVLEPRVVVAHDYLTQRGGAERVVLAICRALGPSPLVTSLYDSETTFAEFADLDIRTTSLQRYSWIRRNHRWALPFYAAVFSHLRVDADVVVCSTAGWAHGLSTNGRKILYVHNTARWLYQTAEYLPRLGPWGLWLVNKALGPLRKWDRRHAVDADLILVNSRNVQERVRRNWGLDATILYAPPTIDVSGPGCAVSHVEPGYLLVVSRLLAYKRIDAIIEAMRLLPAWRLVVVGEGPERERLLSELPANCQLVPHVDEEQLRWLYRHCRAVVAAGHEDFGLVPLEAMSFGRPVVARRAGGYVETVIDGVTGVFFDRPEPDQIAAAIVEARHTDWDVSVIAARAAEFSETAFAASLRVHLAAQLSGRSPESVISAA
jgi:glycosyltransferase involved in cell wall biosynthesis